MESTCCAVKLSWIKMNKKGFILAFRWKQETSPLHTYFTFCFNNFANLSLVPVLSSSVSSFSITPPACSVSFLSPILVSIYISLSYSFSSPPPPPLHPRLHMLCLGLFTWLEERKGEERATLNYTCSNSGAPIQLGPTRCLPSRFTAFVSVASLYMHSVCLLLFVFLCVVLVNNFRIVAAFRVWGHPFLDKKNWCLHHLLFAFQPCIGQRLQYNCISCHITPLLHVYHMH